MQNFTGYATPLLRSVVRSGSIEAFAAMNADARVMEFFPAANGELVLVARAPYSDTLAIPTVWTWDGAALSAGEWTQARKAEHRAEEVHRAAAVLGLAPVLALYILIDLERFKSNTLEVTPPKHREEFSFVAGQVGTALGSFVRGQLLVSVIVGFASSVGMWLIDLPFWLLIGIVVVGLLIMNGVLSNASRDTVTYSRFLSLAENGDIDASAFDYCSRITGAFPAGDYFLAPSVLFLSLI